jgi:hypothetical protein
MMNIYENPQYREILRKDHQKVQDYQVQKAFSVDQKSVVAGAVSQWFV